MIKNTAKWLGVVAALGMFLVLIMGAAVTNTGSEQGCGRSWPLCHGQLIPQFAVATAIEFSHRAVVGIESFLIIGLAALSLLFYRRYFDVRLFAPLMVIFLFVQAGLGAWAVAYPQMDAALALHFGVSLISFASVLLVTVFLFELDGVGALRNRPVPTLFRWAVWGTTGYSYIVVYLGAYVRHTKADLSCHGWPLCNGQVIPALGGTVGTNFVHRFAAGLLILAIVSLVIWAYGLRVERPDLFWASLVALGAVALQALSGAIVVITKLDLFSALMHAALAGVTFGTLSYLCVHVLPQRATLQTVAGLAGAPQVTAGRASSGQ